MNEEDDIQRELEIERMDMSFISSDDEDMQWINKFAEGKIQVGLTTGVRVYRQTLRLQEGFHIINGHSNIGKTTFALYLMVNSQSDMIGSGWSTQQRTKQPQLR